MTTLDASHGPIVVLSGSFRRDLSGLLQARTNLISAGCVVLSPEDVNFVSEINGFVLSEGQADPAGVEATHLASICRADFVWLHVANDGYVGRSASMEIGFANAIGIPIFSTRGPDDEALASLVRVVESPQAALRLLDDARLPELGRPLRVLQAYYGTVARDRGYDAETPQDVMLLLTEEMGELARAVRRHAGLIREGGYGDENPAEELADIQLYLVHLANALKVDLAQAVSDKESVNSRRHADAVASENSSARFESVGRHPTEPADEQGPERETVPA